MNDTEMLKMRILKRILSDRADCIPNKNGEPLRDIHARFGGHPFFGMVMSRLERSGMTSVIDSRSGSVMVAEEKGKKHYFENAPDHM